MSSQCFFAPDHARIKKALTGVLRYYCHPSTKVEAYHMTKDALVDALTNSNTSEYPNLHPYALRGETNALYDLMLKLRSKEVQLDASQGIIDLVSTTLAFISRAGAVTEFHMDWTEAINVALSIEVCVIPKSNSNDARINFASSHRMIPLPSSACRDLVCQRKRSLRCGTL